MNFQNEIKMCESVNLSEIRGLEDDLLEQLSFTPPELKSLSLGRILRAERKYVR